MLISRCTIYPTHSYGELFYDITKYSATDYLTLQNDSYTACNTIALILNARIPDAIVLAKRGNLPWYNKFFLLIHLIDMECTHFLSQLWSERIIQHQYKEIPLIVLFTCQTISLFLPWNGVISYDNEITKGVFISRYTMIPQTLYGESCYDITK